MLQKEIKNLTPVFLLFFSSIFIYYDISLQLFGLQYYPKINDDSSEVSMIFVGDIMLARSIAEKIEETRISYPFEATKQYLESSDYRVGNLECVFSTRGNLIEGRKMPFQVDPTLVDGLKYADFNLLTLANNHILDFGSEALNDTIGVLTEFTMH